MNERVEIVKWVLLDFFWNDGAFMIGLEGMRNVV